MLLAKKSKTIIDSLHGFQGELGPDVSGSALAEEFTNHADKVCQIAAMASASSMDPKST
jgi:hypothetical protein